MYYTFALLVTTRTFVRDDAQRRPLRSHEHFVGGAGTLLRSEWKTKNKNKNEFPALTFSWFFTRGKKACARRTAALASDFSISRRNIKIRVKRVGRVFGR